MHSFLLKTREHKKSASGPHVQQSYNHQHLEKLHFTQCDWQQLLQVKERARDRCSLVDGILMSRDGRAEDDDHTHLIGALHQLINRSWLQGKRMETYCMLSVKMLSAREAASLKAVCKVVRGTAKILLSSSIHVERECTKRKPKTGETVDRGGASLYGVVEGDEGMKAGCREQEISTSLIKELKARHTLIARVKSVVVWPIALKKFRLQ